MRNTEISQFQPTAPGMSSNQPIELNLRIFVSRQPEQYPSFSICSPSTVASTLNFSTNKQAHSSGIWPNYPASNSSTPLAINNPHIVQSNSQLEANETRKLPLQQDLTQSSQLYCPICQQYCSLQNKTAHIEKHKNRLKESQTKSTPFPSLKGVYFSANMLTEKPIIDPQDYIIESVAENNSKSLKPQSTDQYPLQQIIKIQEDHIEISEPNYQKFNSKKSKMKVNAVTTKFNDFKKEGIKLHSNAMRNDFCQQHQYAQYAASQSKPSTIYEHPSQQTIKSDIRSDIKSDIKSDIRSDNNLMEQLIKERNSEERSFEASIKSKNYKFKAETIRKGNDSKNSSPSDYFSDYGNSSEGYKRQQQQQYQRQQSRRRQLQQMREEQQRNPTLKKTEQSRMRRTLSPETSRKKRLPANKQAKC